MTCTISSGDGEKEKKHRRRGAAARNAILEGSHHRERGKEQSSNSSSPKLVDDAQKTGGKSTISEAAQDAEKSRVDKKKKSRKRPSSSNSEEKQLSRTQLRNHFKRKARKRQRTAADDHQPDNDEGESKDNAGSVFKKNKKRKISATNNTSEAGDPSCAYLDDPESAPLVKSARSFMTNILNKKASLSKTFRITTGPKIHWRTVSKLAVRKGTSESSSLEIGLFKPGSHDVVPVPNCTAHHPSINAAVPVIQEACIKCNVQPYSEEDGAGHLRYLSINVERSTGAVQVTLVWNDCPEAKNDVLDALIKMILDMTSSSPKKKMSMDMAMSKSDTNLEQSQLKLHSLWVHFHAASKHNNAIFGREANSWKCMYGPTAIEEVIDITVDNDESSKCPYQVKLEFPPNVFRQANIDAFARIVGVIRKRIVRYNAEDRVSNANIDGKVSNLPACVELYGGVGTIGLHLVDLMSKFVSSDENPHNVDCFNKTVSKLPEELKKRASYISKNAADMVADGALDDAEIFIVDPPRKGLDKEVLDALTAKSPSGNSNGPKLLVYVSCGFSAFKRDCQCLLKSGLWNLEQGEGFVLFPGSDAIETLAFFVRK